MTMSIMARSPHSLASKHGGLSRGYTLVELSIAVAIAGVIAFSSLAFVPKIYDEIELSRFTQRLTNWVFSTEKIFLSRADYVGLNLQSIADLGLLDKDLITRNPLGEVTTVKHLYGGKIEAQELKALDNKYWAMHFSNLPAKICVPVLQGVSGLGHEVLMVKELGGSSSMTDWIDGIKFDTAKTNIESFPVGYKTIRKLSEGSVAVDEMIRLCGSLGKERMGLVLIRKKM